MTSVLVMVPPCPVMIFCTASLSRITSSSLAPGSMMKTTSYVLFSAKSNLLVVQRHRFGNAISQNRAHRIGATLQNLFQGASFDGRKFIQHKLLRIAYRMLWLNSDPQANELVSPQRRDDRFQTVVPASAAARAQTNRAKGQSQIVADYD